MSETPTVPTPKPSFKERFDALLEAYGYLVIVVWLSISATTFASFYFAIEAGLDVSPVVDWAVAQGCSTPEAAERSGTAAVACIGLQASKPLRFFLTAFLVPIVARMRKAPDSPAE